MKTVVLWLILAELFTLNHSPVMAVCATTVGLFRALVAVVKAVRGVR